MRVPALLHDEQARATFVALLLMVPYCAPIYLGFFALFASDGMQESSTWVAWFAAYLKSSDSTLSEFHKVLLPAISALSIAAYVKRPTRGMLVLQFFVFVSFVFALATTIWFDVKSVQDGLEGLGGGLTAADAKQFLGRIRETLLMYFMMLVGLQAANRAKDPEPAPAPAPPAVKP